MADWEITFNGLTLGPDPYGLRRVTGFHDSPEVRSVDEVRARSHGQWNSADYLGGRTIQASIIITSRHPSNAIWQAVSQALVAGQAGELPMLAQMPGVALGNEVLVNAKVRRLSLPIDMDYTLGLGRADVEWHCSDPRIYSSTSTEVVISQATSSGGLLMPAVAPLVFSGTASGGIGITTNAGEFPAPWTATINGPVTNPRIENVTLGKTVSFTGTVASGETLVVSSLDKTVLLNGAASRYSWLTSGSTWFDLGVGDSTIRFAGASGSGSMTLSYRSVWI